MPDDNKEVKQEGAAPAPESAAPAAAAPADPTQEKPAPEKPKIEKPANCAACNKSIKKKLFYYRNGKYYCNKRCWKTTLKKEEKPEDKKA